MKSIQLLGSAALIGAALFLGSCEKDRTTSNPKKSVVEPIDTTGDENNTKVLVVNALGENGQIIDLHLNGNKFVEDLGLKDLTQYIDLDEGEVKLDLFDQDGNLIVSSNVNLFKQKIYNIVISAGEDGVTPAITVLGLDLTNFQGGDSFADLLKLGGGNGSGTPDFSGINFLDLTKGLQTDNLLMGADFVNQLGKVVPGILNLNSGEFSDPIFGNSDVLKNLTMLNSTLPFEDLLKQLQQGGGTTNPGGGTTTFPQLDEFFAILSNNPTGILDFVGNLLRDLLGLGGGTSNPLTPLTGNLLDPSKLANGHDYTMILSGTKSNPVVMLIDQTMAGFPTGN
ncbi:MAG: hypothetical protein V4616_04840 [Bacteroidota bacterium]